MIMSCHQPQYLPWLGYIDKIRASDVFVYLERVQYKKREYQNRNRIKTKDGPLSLAVPVKTKDKYDQLICDVEIDNTDDWRKKHWRAIEVNYHKAPHFNDHKDFFEDLYLREWRMLAPLNEHIIGYILEYLQIVTPIQSDLALDVHAKSTDRIIEICKAVGADAYLSGAGGKSYLEEEKVASHGIRLSYQDFKHPEYPQLYGEFIPYLSTIDLLFNCGKESANILIGKL